MDDPRAPIERDEAKHGWVLKRGNVKSKAWRRRYCVFEPRRCVFTYYGSKESAEANATPKGSVEVTRAARGDAHNAGEDSRHGFRFNTSEGRIFECAVEGTNAQAEIDE